MHFPRRPGPESTVTRKTRFVLRLGVAAALGLFSAALESAGAVPPGEGPAKSEAAAVAVRTSGAAEAAAAATNASPDATPIDRPALIARQSPVLHRIDYGAPLSVGNGGFAFTVDITGLQTFGEQYYRHGIPLETLARWAWISDPNDHGYTLADASTDFREADGRIQSYPTKAGSPAGDWLRKNPRDQPLAQLALDWAKPDGSALTPADIVEPEQTLDLWSGIVTSRFKLGGVPVKVTTGCNPYSDRIAVTVESALVSSGKLRVRMAFPRGHDVKVKNTPPLDWSQPESHTSTRLDDNTLLRAVQGLEYYVSSEHPIESVRGSPPHTFYFSGENDEGGTLSFSLAFTRRIPADPTTSAPEKVYAASSAWWEHFWRSSALLDLSGSTDPRAAVLERRVILSQYLTAIQLAADLPPQESGLTCSTWYGKHHTEMIWWHTAHFALWGHPELLSRNLAWFIARLPEARALAASRQLKGARWPKMVGPQARESPGGNPLIVWNQPHLIYLSELLYRKAPDPSILAKYRSLVLDTADCMVSMLWLDPKRDQYVLGPPLWIAQEIYDQATSQNPSFELAYWRWALGVAQTWRERLGEKRDPLTDRVLEKLSPLPTRKGRYVALESHPDTWENVKSRHDHPEMLMPLGFLPPTTAVDHATMEHTLDGVMSEWDWETKIWGWDYPMIAMTATRLGRPETAVDVLLRDGPNNRYTANGHCPQRSDVAVGLAAEAGTGDEPGAAAGSKQRRSEIAVYLPANGALLSAVALMVAGWDGNTIVHPGFPKDGKWQVKAEGWQALP